MPLLCGSTIDCDVMQLMGHERDEIHASHPPPQGCLAPWTVAMTSTSLLTSAHGMANLPWLRVDRFALLLCEHLGD